MFFGQNGMPSAIYYSNDAFLLSHSGIKRLVDALNRHTEMVLISTFVCSKFLISMTKEMSGREIIIAQIIIMDVQGKVTEDENLIDLGTIIVAVMAV